MIILTWWKGHWIWIRSESGWRRRSTIGPSLQEIHTKLWERTPPCKQLILVDTQTTSIDAFALAYILTLYPHGQSQFAEDVRAVFDNAMLYNGPESEVYQFAEQLRTIFEAGYEKIVFEEGTAEDEEAKPPPPPSHHKKVPKPEDPYKYRPRLPDTRALLP